MKPQHEMHNITHNNSNSNNTNAMFKNLSLFTSNQQLSAASSSSGVGENGLEVALNEAHPESSSSSSSTVKKQSYHHHLSHIQSYQSLSSVNAYSNDVGALATTKSTNKLNNFLISKPLNRNSRRASMSELGYGKIESYNKLEKLGEVNNTAYTR